MIAKTLQTVLIVLLLQAALVASDFAAGATQGAAGAPTNTNDAAVRSWSKKDCEKIIKRWSVSGHAGWGMAFIPVVGSHVAKFDFGATWISKPALLASLRLRQIEASAARTASSSPDGFPELQTVDAYLIRLTIWKSITETIIEHDTHIRMSDLTIELHNQRGDTVRPVNVRVFSESDEFQLGLDRARTASGFLEFPTATEAGAPLVRAVGEALELVVIVEGKTGHLKFGKGKLPATSLTELLGAKEAAPANTEDATPPTTASTRPKLCGKVLSSPGTSVSGLVVELLDATAIPGIEDSALAARLTDEVKVNAEGAYAFSDVEPGQYILALRARRATESLYGHAASQTPNSPLCADGHWPESWQVLSETRPGEGAIVRAANRERITLKIGDTVKHDLVLDCR